MQTQSSDSLRGLVKKKELQKPPTLAAVVELLRMYVCGGKIFIINPSISMPHAYEIYIEKETETSFQGFSSLSHTNTHSLVENCSIEELKEKFLKMQ